MNFSSKPKRRRPFGDLFAEDAEAIIDNAVSADPDDVVSDYPLGDDDTIDDESINTHNMTLSGTLEDGIVETGDDESDPEDPIENTANLDDSDEIIDEPDNETYEDDDYVGADEGFDFSFYEDAIETTSDDEAGDSPIENTANEVDGEEYSDELIDDVEQPELMELDEPTNSGLSGSNENPVAEQLQISDYDWSIIVTEGRRLGVFDVEDEDELFDEDADFFNEARKKFTTGAARIKQWSKMKSNFLKKSMVLATAKKKKDPALKRYYTYKEKMKEAYAKLDTKYGRLSSKKAKLAVRAELQGKSGIKKDTPNIKGKKVK